MSLAIDLNTVTESLLTTVFGSDNNNTAKKSLMTNLASGGPTVQIPTCVLVKLDIAELNKKSAYELHACASIAPPITDAANEFKLVIKVLTTQEIILVKTKQ